MIAVIQRVSSAAVYIDSKMYSSIQKGVLCFLGIEKEDTPSKAEKLIEKIASLRIFADSNGKMNLSLKDLDYEILVVSQFTLAASCQKGNRPSFATAAPPEPAEALYRHSLDYAKKIGLRLESGCFGADMKINLTNDGPVSFILNF